MYREHHSASHMRDYRYQEPGTGRSPQFHGKPRSVYDAQGSSYYQRGRRRYGVPNRGRTDSCDGRRYDRERHLSCGPSRAISPVRTVPMDPDPIRANHRLPEPQRIPTFGYDRNQADHRRQNDDRYTADDRRPTACHRDQPSKPPENPYHRERYYLSNRLPTGQFIDKRPGPVNGERRQFSNDECSRPQVTVAEGDINRYPLLSTLPPAKEVVHNHVILPLANYGTETGKRNHDQNSEVFMPDPNSEDEELRAMMDMKMEVLELHYREKEAENVKSTIGSSSVHLNGQNFAQTESENGITDGNSTTSARDYVSSSKRREKQQSSTISKRKEPVSISASQLPVYSVACSSNSETGQETELPSKSLKKRKKKNFEKAVEDEFEFPLKKIIKEEPNAGNPEPSNVPQSIPNENIPEFCYEYQEENIRPSVPNVSIDSLQVNDQDLLLQKEILKTKYEEIRQRILNTETEMQNVIEQYFRKLKMMFHAPPRRPPPYKGRFETFHAIYHDPFKWSLVKGIVGFAAGVFVARQIGAEVATM